MKNYVYLLRVKHRKRYGYLPIESSDDYEYHAFVDYCDSNRTWVHNEFVKRLETEEGLKFCIHHRDFVAGDTISGNVDNFLKESWKVVVIMSNALAKSEWCQWEIDIVQERRRRQGRDALVLIMLKNINSKNMTSPLRTLLDSTPYIRYKKGIGEDYFLESGCRRSLKIYRTTSSFFVIKCSFKKPYTCTIPAIQYTLQIILIQIFFYPF
ncbi:unnamed protein product [Mytilus coruscus]|uniref:TIR domain-containing protein n=1 Tax=Mytilus coruscus TaxID=42192 RepID=A0A6J8E199_MYTCO|nr:unnamed protein product [Mytilus coruscus]